MVCVPSFIVLTWGALAAAKCTGPLLPRTVASLNQAAADEAQQRDGTATRAFSDVQITTSDGRCLFVNKLSGDFRENLTPVEVATCGTTDGQGWDVITAGRHIDVANSALIVSTSTQACLNFDPRRAVGNQVLLFSCGGRADGGGQVALSQIFSFNGTAGPLPLKLESATGFCLTISGDTVSIADCDTTDPNQSFVFGNAAAADVSASSETSSVATTARESSNEGLLEASRTSMLFSTQSQATSSVLSTEAVARITGSVTAIAVPDSPVPVSRGGTLSPSAAAEANPRDITATRNFTSVTIRAPNGQCLFVDPTAGDFRENLIPVSLVDCSGTPNERWDIITAGKHNDVPGTALIVSSLMNGCVSFDSRRAVNDTVTMFSCGGRADGGGQTSTDQLMPFIGADSFAFAPLSKSDSICFLPGDGRLVSGDCPSDGAQLFSVFP